MGEHKRLYQLFDERRYGEVNAEIVLAVISGGIGAALVSGVFNIIMWRLNKKSKESQRDKDIVDGLKMIMYDRIKFLAQRAIQDGQITADALEDLIEMHKVYHNQLDGNGFLDSLMNQVKNLKIG